MHGHIAKGQPCKTAADDEKDGKKKVGKESEFHVYFFPKSWVDGETLRDVYPLGNTMKISLLFRGTSWHKKGACAKTYKISKSFFKNLS